MDAVNKSARNAAIGKFIGIYGLSLVAVIVCAYFLFNVPAGIFKNKIELYKTTEDEQTNLMNKIDGATTSLNNLVQADKNYASSTNDIEKGNLQTQANQYQKGISNVISELQSDSTSFISPISRKNSYNYAIAFNTILSYRNAIGQLQSSLLAKGGDAAALVKAQSDLQACNTQLAIAKLAAAASAKPAPPSGGGGGSMTNNAKEAQLQAQLAKAQEDLEACKRDKLALQSAQPSGKTSNLSESQKATLLFETGQALYEKAEGTKNLIERRGILSSAKDVLEKSSPSYPDGDKVNKILKKVDNELKKLSNMG
ncbi:MAG: hypothetical protein JST47_13405 [Bacteroidetes bacterium]|nr:hypothetical protein [Bacteroidota bacterium]MBS1974952.1 hypothetical protein [Bacteroidota bacterium]